jgi:TolB-like protein/DNA-binding winged helix-turn-helix (wHTH) protein/Flp pilus assembly protein TadD
MSDSKTIRSYRFGPFHLDLVAYQFRQQERRVHLERRPMELLILFLERRGELVTRQDIVARLWDQDVFVDIEAAVNTVVWKLRSALRDSPESPRFIETVPGKGYRFIASVEIISGAGEASSPGPEAGVLPLSMPGVVAEPAAPQIVHLVNEATAKPGKPEAVSPPSKNAAPWWRRAAAARRVTVALVLLVFILALGWFTAQPPRTARTIAVLPFQNLSEDSGRQYLADGLHEEIIASLGQIGTETLSVIGRRSTLAFEGTTKSLAQIGKELSADYLVEGSVRVEGDRLRATAKLIRAGDQVQIWSQSYDQNLSSMLTLQRELSTAIASQITARLTSARVGAVARRQTHDPEAYDLYLRGRSLWRRVTPATNLSAIEYYRRATDRDPHYALAWAGISDAYAGMPINADVAPSTVGAQARAAAQRAFESGGELAEVQFTLGFVSYYFDWDWKAAEASFRRATAVNPGHAVAYRQLGHTLSQMRRHDEAREAMDRAANLDPFDPMNHALASQVAFQARNYPTALENAKRTLALDPEFWVGYMQEAQAYEQMRRPDLALEALSTGARLSSNNSKTLSLRGYILATTGRAGEAREVLRTLETMSSQRFVPPYAFALVYAGLGEPDTAFYWLEKAYEGRDVHLMFLTVDPKWDPYRSDPRFKTLVARCGFPVET